jgi:hypothetical protein
MTDQPELRKTPLKPALDELSKSHELNHGPRYGIVSLDGQR